MNILAIETTCDETAIAILKSNSKSGAKIISNIVSSQIEIHAPFGGVVPSLAKREHQKNLIPILELSLKSTGLISELKTKERSIISPSQIKKIENILRRDGELKEKTIEFIKKYKKPKIDFLSIAYGPGLEPALWPGINLVRALSYFWNIPIEKVNHLEAHILANWLPPNNLPKKSDFPIVALLVSGGHTQLILMKEIGKYRIIGETRDDAAGECFDKTARLLGLGYPGGPAISKEAEKWMAKISEKNIESNIKLPRPMMHDKSFDFSFSGLKTATLYLIEKLKKDGIKFSPSKIQEIANEIQSAIIDVLVYKTIKAAGKYKAKKILLAGGVAANKKLRDELEKNIKKDLPNVKFNYPEIKYSTDNGAMITIATYFHQKYNYPQSATWQRLRANSNLRLGNLR